MREITRAQRRIVGTEIDDRAAARCRHALAHRLRGEELMPEIDRIGIVPAFGVIASSASRSSRAALLTSTRIAPSRASAAAMDCFNASMSRRSSTSKCGFSNFSRASVSASATDAAASMSQNETRAPFDRNARTNAAPMPEPPPVI